MTLNHALFLYGFDINITNQFVDFRAVSAGPVLTATLNIGNYTLTGLLAEIKRAMQIVDINNIYTISVDRTVNAGRENRVRIQTSGAYLDLLFLTGPNEANSPATLIGFEQIDYTGGTNYAGSNSAGTILIPDLATYGVILPDDYVMNQGVKNVSSSGVKETLVFAQMFFTEGQWKYITDEDGNTQHTEWRAFMKYAIKQLKFEYTPSFEEDATEYFQVTLEKTPQDGTNGMSYTLPQMLGDGLFRYYDTGKLTFRLVPL